VSLSDTNANVLRDVGLHDVYCCMVTESLRSVTAKFPLCGGKKSKRGSSTGRLIPPVFKKKGKQIFSKCLDVARRMEACGV
jgi:hypothetical protein